jgi:hypothetical protein
MKPDELGVPDLLAATVDMLKRTEPKLRAQLLVAMAKELQVSEDVMANKNAVDAQEVNGTH